MSALEGITQAPWHVEDGALLKEIEHGPTGWFVCHQGTECDATALCWVEKEADARLIADAPTLALEVERLRALNEMLVQAIGRDAARFRHCAEMIGQSFGISGTLRSERTMKATHYALEAEGFAKVGAA